MIGAIAARLLALGIGERWARPIAWALLILAIAGTARLLWGAWISTHDKAVVAADRDAAAVQVLTNSIAADRAAGAAKDDRDAAFRNEQSNLQEKADAAAGNGASPLDAVFDELR